MTGQSLNRLCVAKLQARESGSWVAATGILSPEFLKETVRRWHGELIGLVLFGSAARGDATEDSDLDLLLVMRPQVKIVRNLYRLWEEFCRGYTGPQDISRISPHFVKLPGGVGDAGGLWYEAALDGLVLWACDDQITSLFGSLREAMSTGRIQRRMLHGSPYWINEL